MTLSDIVGNEAAVSAISAAINKGSFHAYIISGPAGSGKTLAASVLASGFVCTASEGQKPCGRCAACRKAMHGSHPDIITAAMEGKTSFLVSQARAVREDVFILPNEAARKVYILPDAAYMQPAAQNALLKVLEEPPEYAVFILISENASSLLDTVRSRCVEIAMRPVERNLVYSYLSKHRPGVPKPELEAAVRGCGGLIGKALDLLGGDVAAESAARDICEALGDANELNLYKAFFKLEGAGRDEIRQCFQTVQSILRDALILKTGAGDALMPAFGNTAKKLCAKYTSERLANAVTAAEKAYGRTSAYLSPGNLLAGTAAELYTVLSVHD
jgi:DNA polymerase-3 subunit delta'